MIAEIGLFALILAFCVALVQAVVPLAGASRGNFAWMNMDKPAARVQFALVAIAFLALILCYTTSDFSVLNVVENSHTDKPMIYKISGVWGNHEGSMLLWVLILSLYGVALTFFSNHIPPGLRARALAVQAL